MQRREEVATVHRAQGLALGHDVAQERVQRLECGGGVLRILTDEGGSNSNFAPGGLSIHRMSPVLIGPCVIHRDVYLVRLWIVIFINLVPTKRKLQGGTCF